MPSSSVPAVDHEGCSRRPAVSRDAKYEVAFYRRRDVLLAKASQRQQGVYPTYSFQTRRIARSKMKNRQVSTRVSRGVVFDDLRQFANDSTNNLHSSHQTARTERIPRFR